jgi:hypothetical protein
MKIGRTLLAAITTLVLMLGATASVNAQSGSVGGRPANPDSSNSRTKSIFVKTISPGQKASDAVEVINNTKDTKTVSVYSVDSISSSGGAFACAQAVDKKIGVGKWISMSKDVVVLKAGETTKVPFTISVPQDASVGEQNGCIVLQEQKEATVQGGIGLSFRTAIRVAVLVPGKIEKNIQATGLAVRESADKLVLTPSAKNTGNVSLDTSVSTKIMTVFNTTISSQENTFPVLRDQLTQWNFEFEKPFWGGFYRATYSLTYDESQEGSLGSIQKRPKTVEGPSKTVFVQPQPLALIFELLIVVALLALLYAIKKKRDHKYAVAHHWQNYSVKQGDDVQLVAKNFGINWKLLARSNNLKAPYKLSPNSTIKVPHQRTKRNKSKKIIGK